MATNYAELFTVPLIKICNALAIIYSTLGIYTFIVIYIEYRKMFYLKFECATSVQTTSSTIFVSKMCVCVICEFVCVLRA